MYYIFQKEKEAAALAQIAKSKTSIAANPKSPFQAYGGREITKTGVSIQPKGTFKLDSKISLGSFNSDSPKNGDSGTSVTSKSSYSNYSKNGDAGTSVTSKSSYSSYSMSSSSNLFKY